MKKPDRKFCGVNRTSLVISLSPVFGVINDNQLLCKCMFFIDQCQVDLVSYNLNNVIPLHLVYLINISQMFIFPKRDWNW